MKILIVEDERALANSIAAYLQAERYTCEIAADRTAAMEKIESFDYDCILLDIGLPDGSGLDVLEALRADNKTEGVIIISARDAIEDRIGGLRLGADDYLVKPFHLSELGARVAAVIRRRRFAGNPLLEADGLALDPQAKTVAVDGRPVDLTRKEYDLLLYLLSNRNRVISKQAIAEHLSGDGEGLFDNYDFIYAHMKNLKKKLLLAGWTDRIKAIYGMGYKLEAP
ncbi:response regulator transcription factor [Chitinophaga lutea]